MTTNKYPKYFKIILNSTHGSYSNGDWTFYVDMPLFDNIPKTENWVISVQSFYSSVIASTSGNIGNTHLSSSAFANIHIRELQQNTSYSSRTKTNTTIVSSFTGRSVVANPALNTIAIPLNSNFWIQRQLTVFFSDATMTPLITPNDANWQLTLLIYKADD